MKAGKSIVELATEIARQQATKKDYIADTRAIEMQVPVDLNRAQEPGYRPTPVLALKQNGSSLKMPLRDYAHNQLAARLDIPRKYYDRCMAEDPALLAQNVNTWLKKEPERRMVRTLDGHVRAFLSDKYRPLENADLAEAAFPVLAQLGVEIVSSEITERRLYIKAVDRRITKDIPTGRKMGDGSHVFFDTLSPAIFIGNSEVGAGTLSIETGVWTKVCTNLAVTQKAIRKYHVGARADIGEDVMAMLSDGTKRVTDAALWMQVRDVIKGAFDRAHLDAVADKLMGMTQDKIDGDPMQAIEVTSKLFSLTDSERGGVLKHLIEGGDLSRYGLFNAITRTAEDLADYDRASEFEKFGGDVIELPRNDWQRIAKAGDLKVAA